MAGSSPQNVKYLLFDDNVPLPGIASSNEFDIAYAILEFTPHFVSIGFDRFVDVGGAHPNTADVSFNYDLDHRRIVGLGELFATGPSHLREAAFRTIAVFAKNNDLECDESVRGAPTSVPNHSVWNLAGWALASAFNDCQVGPYAAGPQRVLFPLGSLKLSGRAASLVTAR